MKINLEKHFNKEDLDEESDEESYLPEDWNEDEQNSKSYFRPSGRIRFNLDEIKLECEAKLKSKTSQHIGEKELSPDQILDIAAAAAMSTKAAPLEAKPARKTHYTFADKFYTLVNQSVLKEVEKPAEGPQVDSDAASRKMGYFESLDFQLAAVDELIKSLNSNKKVKLTSILKSKYDWKAFIKSENIEDKMNYQRKDDYLIKNFAINRN